MVRPYVKSTPSRLFFDGACPYYVNRVSESFDLQFHTHEFLEICYIGEGSGTQYIGEAQIPVSRGDLFLLPIGTSHVFRPRFLSSEPLVVYNFLLMPEQSAESLLQVPGIQELRYVPALFGLFPGGSADWRCFRDFSGSFHTMMISAYEEYTQRRPGYIPRLHSLLVLLMTELERYMVDEESGGGSLSIEPDRAMRAALAFISSSYTMPVTAAQAAGQAGISERHFHRRFLQTTGVTFNRYVQDLRIAQSKELLRTSDLSIVEIVEAVGYRDTGHFLKLFRKRIGQTPRDYRNFWRGRNVQL